MSCHTRHLDDPLAAHQAPADECALHGRVRVGLGIRGGVNR
jgi:hypothetical protein